MVNSGSRAKLPRTFSGILTKIWFFSVKSIEITRYTSNLYKWICMQAPIKDQKTPNLYHCIQFCNFVHQIRPDSVRYRHKLFPYRYNWYLRLRIWTQHWGHRCCKTPGLRLDRLNNLGPDRKFCEFQGIVLVRFQKLKFKSHTVKMNFMSLALIFNSLIDLLNESSL